ncbi:MAG TPA: type II secretion system minor pseudopilin GspK [Spongiibacteraceae bacterium]
MLIRSHHYKRRCCKRRHRQRGVALITVLLVFALVAVIASEMLHRSQLNLRSVGNLVETRQAYYYALGGEAFARQVLAKDIIDKHGEVDTLTEAWALTKEQQPFEIENGTMQIEINDLQGRFNINSIIDAQGRVIADALAQFARLLNTLQLNPNYAYEWQDWIDRDQIRAPNGAEDADYEGYRTAGHAEADISALRLLHSMQPQDYAKLAPHVTVLPRDDSDSDSGNNSDSGDSSGNNDSNSGGNIGNNSNGSSDSGDGRTKININTADAEVLRSLSSPTLSESQVARIVAQQKVGGYTDVGAAGFDSQTATVKSDFFEVIVTVNYANRWQRLRTVVQRTNESGAVKLKVISRVRSPLIDDIEL